MSTPEEHTRDQFLEMNLVNAENDGAAHRCYGCAGLCHDKDLVEINDMLFCADCAERVCVECGKDLPIMMWGDNATCDDCKEEL